MLLWGLLAGSAHAAGEPATEAEDPAAALHRAHARTLVATGHPFEALATLRLHGADQGPLLARVYAELGLPASAEELLEGHRRDKEASKAWLALGQAYYRQGDYPRAEHALLQMPRNPSDDDARARASLLARTLLRQGRFDEASLALAAQRRRQELPPIDRYNLGIAWLRAGDATRGAGELEAVGRYDGEDPARRLLADHANLKLGYWFLRDRRGGLARSVLQRISLSGPFSEEAMLALGWAELAPAGDVQRLHAERLEECRGPQPELWSGASEMHAVPRRACGGMDEWEDTIGGEPARETPDAAYRRAAVAWREIADAPALRPATQEALVALPYALAQAGDRERARQGYQAAIDRLTAARAALDAGDEPRPPPPLQIEAAARLAALDATLEEMQARLARMEAWLGAPPDAEGPDPEAVARLGELLAKLRAEAPPGRELGSPTGVQRARLQALLRSVEVSRADRGAHADRAGDLLQRVRAARQGLAPFRETVAQARKTIEERRRERLRQRVTLYLEQARLGLASLLE